jgi:hypothetical protein
MAAGMSEDFLLTAYSECLVKCGVEGNPEGTNVFPVVAGAFPEFIDALHNRQPMFTRVVAFKSPGARLVLVFTREDAEEEVWVETDEEQPLNL